MDDLLMYDAIDIGKVVMSPDHITFFHQAEDGGPMTRVHTSDGKHFVLKVRFEDFAEAYAAMMAMEPEE